MLQTHVNNDIYNKYCLIHNNRKYVLVLADKAANHVVVVV